MKLYRRYFALITILISGFTVAQVSTGTPPFSSLGGGPFDTVNLGNLNVHFSIPVLHKAGRGVSFVYDLSYDSSIWYQATVNGVVQWSPTGDWGWTSNSYAVLGRITSNTTSKTTSGKFCSGQFATQTIYTTTYQYLDSRRRSHPFPGSTTETVIDGACNSTTYGPGFSATTSDGSGYSITVTVNRTTGATTFTVVTRSGIIVYNGNGVYTDPNGNQLTVNSSTGQFFDTLSGTTAVLTQAGSGTPTSPVTYTYVAPSGVNAVYTVNYTQYTVATDFGVSGVAEYGRTSNPLPSSIQLPDGSEYQFKYEITPGSCTPLSGTYSANCITGRLLSVQLPTGGKITYGYTGGSDGIESDGSTAGLTRALTATTTAPAQSWSYTRALVNGTPGPGSTWTTTVVDTRGNNTVINFAEDGTVTNTGSTPQTIATYNFYETQRQVYQGSVSPSNLLVTTIECYNANYSSCATTPVSSPITQTDLYTELPNGKTRLSQVLYNGYGLVYDDKEYNYGVTLNAAPSSTYLVRETATTYGSYSTSGCTTLSNGIYNRPCQVKVYDWSSGSQVTLASSTYTYDQTTPTSTSGTPQHVSITGSRGNVTTATSSTSSSTSLTKTATYYDTGNVYQANDVNGAQTTYTYGVCGNSFPTQIVEPLSLSRSFNWNCTGGVSTEATDENGNNVTSDYTTDPDFWRPDYVTDQMSNQTNIKYDLNPTATETTLNFNGATSTSDVRTTLDGFGRIDFKQRLQTQGGANYDTSEADYNNLGQPYISKMPYSDTGSPSSENTSAPATTTTYDALGRVLTTTDANGGYVSYTYTNNDVLQTVGGGRAFKKQFEYDGLGRLMSVCEISGTLPGIGTCAQTTSQTGYWTKYTYDALGHLLTVTQNAQAAGGSQQTRTFVYDMLGRITSETNPETGTKSYVYDSDPGSDACSSGARTSSGDLVRTNDARGDACYVYDSLHRVTDVGFNNSSYGYCKRFRYDGTLGVLGAIPTGVSVANTKGRVAEAETDTCAWPITQASIITDEWSSYDKRGELTDLYESTPHSGGYYHSNAAYWANGVVNTLSLKNSSGTALIPIQTYAVDGEGRPNLVSAASGQNPVTSVTYSTSSTTNALGALTNVTFGSADSDAFSYDPNTGRMETYTFSVNTKTDVGTLTWNANGTLSQLVINDQIPSTTDSQTCTYGYDDVKRLSNVTCGTFWVQNFTYDAFGNITKNVPSGDGGLSFLPSYFTSPPTNQFSTLPGVTPHYDAVGNLLTDNLNTYTWDAYGNMATVSTGSSTVTATYDASGRMVENNAGSSYTEFVYGPTGKLAKCNGQTLLRAFVALPGGAKAIYTSSGLAYYRHSDWLGSSRLTSTATPPTSMYSSSAYAPFGEQYGTAGSADASFTGQDQDTVSNLYDFPARRQSPSQGRWISPDPAGRASATLTNPQSWNRYVYALNNPLRLIDSMGLQVEDGCGDDEGGCDGGGGGDGGGGDGGGDAGGDGWGGWGPEGSNDPGEWGIWAGDNSGNDNGGDPSQNCDEQCQADQALQSATLAMLTNSNCAALIGGPSATGQAAAVAAVAGQLFGNPNPTISFSAEPEDIGGFAETVLTQIPTPGITISLSTNFYDPGYTAQNGVSSLSFAQNQTVTILHEYGHAMGDLHAINNNGQYGYGITTNIMSPDNPLTNPGVSSQNDHSVTGACLQGGDVPTQTSQVDGTIQ